MTLWILLAAWSRAADAPVHDKANDEDVLVVELVDSGAARSAELRCPSGYKDAAAFTYGRAVLRAPEDDCTLHFGGQEATFGPTGPGELLCELSGGVACFSVCDPDAR